MYIRAILMVFVMTIVLEWNQGGLDQKWSSFWKRTRGVSNEWEQRERRKMGESANKRPQNRLQMPLHQQNSWKMKMWRFSAFVTVPGHFLKRILFFSIAFKGKLQLSYCFQHFFCISPAFFEANFVFHAEFSVVWSIIWLFPLSVALL